MFRDVDPFREESRLDSFHRSLKRVKEKSWKVYQKTETPTPRVVIAKKYGYDQCGIMMPNIYFDAVDRFEHLNEVVTRKLVKKPWEHRAKRVFWRGSIRTQPDCEDESGNYARTEAVALTARRGPRRPWTKDSRAGLRDSRCPERSRVRTPYCT